MGKNVSSSAATVGVPRKSGGCCGVRWGQVFYYQTWGALVVLLAAAIITGVAHFFTTPAFRPLRLYDAGISLPLAPHDTVSIEAAGLIPFAALVVTVLLVEFAAMAR